MTFTYAKRMVLRREGTFVPPREGVPGLILVPWSRRVLAEHAVALWQSFVSEHESSLFPSFATETGCHDYFHDLTNLPEFAHDATWLAMADGRPVGTIQAIVKLHSSHGEIQNVGVVPSHRQHGVGSALIARCLEGLIASGCRSVSLEVSESNERATRLYRKFGFESYKTVYTPIRMPISDAGSGI